MITNVNLEWKAFNVDLEGFAAAVKALDNTCCGSSANTALQMHFTSDPYAIPMHEVTEEVEQQASDEDGVLLTDENGDPIMETIEVTRTEPTGEPSIAEQVVDMWAAIESNSQMATDYTLKAQKAAMTIRVGAAIKFGNDLLTEFSTENLLMGITADGDTEEVLDTMAPIMAALQSGSLTVAIKRAKAISNYDAKYITAVRLLKYVNKIEVFMSLPLSQSL